MGGRGGEGKGRGVKEGKEGYDTGWGGGRCGRGGGIPAGDVLGGLGTLVLGGLTERSCLGR